MTDEATAVVDQEQEADPRARDLEHYDEIRTLNYELRTAHNEWEILKDKTASAKKRCDELGKRLSHVISRGPDDQQRLAFGSYEEQDWQDVPIVNALALSESQFCKLAEEDIRTMGELEEYRATQGLHTIKGFGEVAITKIEEQIIDWLDENRDRFGECVDEEQCDENEEPTSD